MNVKPCQKLPSSSLNGISYPSNQIKCANIAHSTGFDLKISILEDDDAQADLMQQWLGDAGHVVFRAKNCDEMRMLLLESLPDLVILDWELPDGTGIDMLGEIRNGHQPEVPVLFTTQRDAEEDIVLALKHGADDYLVKPLRVQEFNARLHALSRRAGIKDASDVLIEGPFQIDTRKEKVLVSGQAIKMTQKDYAVCLCLFENIGKALSREFLLKSVWGVEAGLDTRTVDMHVSRVRRALKIGPENGYVIKTIYQHGYRLETVDA